MPLPPIPQSPFYTWVRARSQGWVERPLQQALLSWGLLFVDEHSWVLAKSLRFEERFADQGISVRVPYGPTGPPQSTDNFLQRPGLPFLKVSVARALDHRAFEIGVPFEQGNATSGVLERLAAAREGLRAQEISSR